MQTIRRQRGMTFIGLVFVLLLFVLVAGILMKVIPAYSEFFTVEKMLNQIKTEDGFSEKSADELRQSFDRRAVTGYVTVIKSSDLKIDRSRNGNVVTAEYEVRNHLVANAYLVLHFFASTDPDAQPSIE